MRSYLKEIIENRGIKITWLSDRSGVSRNTIHTYINGGVPALDKAYAIAKALELPVYEIWKDEETAE
ncbi:helix-turn-helix transcriptional regulator [Cytobacillus firmus]|uniref:helix-turn-helix transcriptional regulator n=1 Tax=Cytobacillus firmus TaxID=1399 RepID=UPI00369F8F25